MDQEQFKKEILPLRPRLLSYATRILEDNDDAEDIIQEVFIKLWSFRKELYQYNSIIAFSTTITKNLCINKLKAQKKFQNNLDDIVILPSEGLSPHKKLEQKDNLQQVLKIIDQLPNVQQCILKMKHIEGLEINEIAELTGSTSEAIRTNLSRARKRVKDIFFKMQSE